MKLPKDMRKLDLWTPQLFEAIVRDCAAYCSIGCTRDQYASPEIRKQIGDMILARYGLEDARHGLEPK